MLVIDAISEILKKEGIKYLSAFPTTSVIEAAAESGIAKIPSLRRTPWRSQEFDRLS